MSKKQSENVSKRQSRREELRKKERQQRIIVISVLALIVVIIAVIIYTSTQKVSGGPITSIKVREYKNAEGTALGDPNAKVKIDVFEDYQCIHCKDYTENVEPQVIAQLVDTGRAYYVFHQYPFLDSPNADQGSHRAALASECAAEQNNFWNYKGIVFANYSGVDGEFSAVRLEAFAKSIKLNVEQFKTCLSEAKYQAKLDEGLSLGAKMDVKGTPSIFVNGVLAKPSFADISAAVQKAEAGG